MTFGTICLMSGLVAFGAFLGRLAEPPERTFGAVLRHLCVLVLVSASIAVVVNRMVELWQRF